MGWSEFTGGLYHAALWTGTTPTDLGTLGGIYSTTNGITSKILAGVSNGSIAWPAAYTNTGTISFSSDG